MERSPFNFTPSVTKIKSTYVDNHNRFFCSVLFPNIIIMISIIMVMSLLPSPPSPNVVQFDFCTSLQPLTRLCYCSLTIHQFRQLCPPKQ